MSLRMRNITAQEGHRSGATAVDGAGAGAEKHGEAKTTEILWGLLPGDIAGAARSDEPARPLPFLLRIRSQTG